MGWRRSAGSGAIARSGVYRHRRRRPRHRPGVGPMGALSDAALAAAIRAVLAASPFHGEGHRKVWARLRYAGTRTSLRRVLRLMREHDLLAPGRVGSPRGPRGHDGTIIPETIDTMWGTDLTATFTGKGPRQYSSRWIIAPPSASAFTPMREPHASRHWNRSARACADTSAASRPTVAHGLAVRHDHGSQYMSDHFQKEIAFLGIESSPAFVRAPEGNGCAERFIRTLKENLLWVRTFKNDRGIASGAARVPRDLQHNLVDRAARLHQSPAEFADSSFNQSLRRHRLQSGVPETAGGTMLTAAGRFLAGPRNSRAIRTGATACYFTSSSMVTMEPVSAPATKPDGPASSPP